MNESKCSRRQKTIQEQRPRSKGCFSIRSKSLGLLVDHHNSSKTVWPVSRSQSIFLPEFKVRADSERSIYKILNLIASGAYGRVYKVQKGSEDKIYALKVIGKAKIIDENCIAQVKQEVAIQRIVSHHPFIAHILEHWQDRKTLYIMMDYLGGGELFSLIEDHGCLPEDVVRIYVGEIALAIDFLHNAGIVHRDVKDTNVLLDNEGHAVLIDFGLAKWLSPNNKTSTFCGTPKYMAPEILGKEFYGHAVDWWSLGVLTCFALVNQYPRVTTSTESVTLEIEGPSNDTQKHQDPSLTEVVLPDNSTKLSAAAIDLLRRLLQPDPRKRLKSIFSLQRLAFYMGHDIRSYLKKKISPLKLLDRNTGFSEEENSTSEHKAFEKFHSIR